LDLWWLVPSERIATRKAAESEGGQGHRSPSLGDLPLHTHPPGGRWPELIPDRARSAPEGMAATARRAASSVLSRFLLTKPSPASAASAAGKSALLGAGDGLYGPCFFLGSSLPVIAIELWYWNCKGCLGLAWFTIFLLPFQSPYHVVRCSVVPLSSPCEVRSHC
jgi:hypothetical protein